MAYGVQIFAFSIVISSALALTCYKCDSSQSQVCNYGITSFIYDTVECNKEAGGGIFTDWIPKQCVKLVAKGKDGSESVARGCLPKLGDGVCGVVAKTLGVFSSIENQIEDINCYTCDGDKCNSATRYAGLTVFGMILAAIAFLF